MADSSVLPTGLVRPRVGLKLQDAYSCKVEFLRYGEVLRYAFFHHQAPMRYADAIAFWQTDERFRAFFTEFLRDAAFAAYFWEMPPVTLDSVDRAFEFVLVNSPSLAMMRADAGAFTAYFDTARAEDVVTFPNLAGDATLISPRPVEQGAAYPHLAAFCRSAPWQQQEQLWREVGHALAQRLSERPLWLSTSGLGVPWLHVRIDVSPKYYTYSPYRFLRQH